MSRYYDAVMAENAKMPPAQARDETVCASRAEQDDRAVLWNLVREPLAPLVRKSRRLMKSCGS